MRVKISGRRKGLCFRGMIYPHVKEYVRAVRQEIIRVLGGKCIRCGFSDWRALQVDHVDGFPGENRVSASRRLLFYIQKSLREHRNEFQLLCANCNWIKKYENNENARQKVSADLSSGDSVHSMNTNVN
jgi:hypothetical protein